MDKKTGYKAAFEFFRVIRKLKLIDKKRINIDQWRGIRKMLKRKK